MFSNNLFVRGLLLFALAAFAASAFAAKNRPDGYITICKVNQTCTVSSSTNVAFGASDLFTYRVLNANFVCNVATFGSDPIPSKSSKECSIPQNGSGGTVSSSSSSSSSSIRSSSSSSVSSSASSSTSAATGSIISNGRYVITNRLSGRALDVSGRSVDDGANVAQWTYGGGTNQQWDVVRLSNGSYSIRAAHSGKSLDLYAWNPNDGADARQWSWLNAANQHWEIDNVSGNFYTITSRFSNRVLEVQNASTTDGANVGLSTYLSANNQQWTFTRPTSSSSSSASSTPPVVGTGFLAQHGQLRINGNQLVNRNGQVVQLRGMSSHGLQWFGPLMNVNSIRWLRDDWGINLIRAAMYTDQGGYITNPNIKNKVYEIVDAAVALGIYVIVDWHILYDNDPNIHRARAIEFFDEVSRRYGNIPNIIYEIANEPNGSGVTWNNSIRPYAQAVIPVIRRNDPDGLVVVGTGTWSQDVQDAAANPVSFNNVAYAVHFYACSHGQWLRDRISAARARGVAVFITEWGTTTADGSGGVCESETRTWVSYLNQNNISWANWSMAQISNSSAALNPGASNNGNWSAANLSRSGTLVKELMRR